MTELTTSIQSIEAAEAMSLRHRVLRPRLDLADCAYPLDAAPGTRHLGFIMAGDLTGVASVFHEAREGDSDPHAWRVRGVAVCEAARGLGIGGQLIQAIVDYVKHQDADAALWCNGRTGARGFCEAVGFSAEGEAFDRPPFGLHLVFRRRLGGT